MKNTSLIPLIFIPISFSALAVDSAIPELQMKLKESMGLYEVRDDSSPCFKRSVEAWAVAGYHIEELTEGSKGVYRRDMHIKQTRIWTAVGTLYAELDKSDPASCAAGILK